MPEPVAKGVNKMGMERTFQFLNDTFGSYYEKHPIPAPVGFAEREFGFLYHGQTYFRRHLGFASPVQLRQDMKSRPPAHTYYSAAYYERPSAHTMAEKGWKGADLIFDLDADHLVGADKMTYGEMLVAVKEKFRYLVDGFLYGELGYNPNEVHLVFSGGRGYHAHIRDPRVLQLGSVARRQLVDYITKNVPARAFVKTRAVDKERYRIIKSVRVPSATRGGWGGRVTTAVVSDLRRISNDPQAAEVRAQELSKRAGIGLKEAKNVVGAFTGPSDRIEDRLQRLSTGIGDLFEGVGEQTVSRLFDYHLNQLRGFCDEPVSSDVKRLIRAPGSLHGKTGLRAIPLTRDKLDDFDPLVEAVVLDDEPVRITASPAAKPFTLMGQDFKPAPGLQTLPRYAAVFLILRRQALLEGDTPPAPPPPKPAPAAAGGA
jgi:DNA primase small subunit